MATHAALNGDAAVSSITDTHELRPYPPSWIDRLTARVERLPLPASVTYLVATAVVLTLFAMNDWMDRGRFLVAPDLFHIVLGLELVYAVALVHFLDRQADRALARLRPLLRCNEGEYEVLCYRVTKIPARPTLLMSLAGMVVGLGAIAIERLALPAEFRAFILPGKGRYLLEAWLVATWFVFGALFFHTLHQLRLINEIYTRHTHIDLDQFHLLFGFSRVSAWTAIGILVIPYAWYLVVPGLVLDPVGIMFGAFFSPFALVAFLWPLLGIHRLMVESKLEALAGNARMLKGLRAEVHARAGAHTLADVGGVSEAMLAVRGDRDALQKTPTWPWQPGTPRGVAAALLLPIIIWLLQFVLEKFLR
jgi:hypothetical protein